MENDVKYTTIFLLFFVSSVCSDIPVQIKEKLRTYKQFIIEGTYAGQDWSGVVRMPKSRYYTFKKAFCYFATASGKRIVELGTSRSFVHGGLAGCNSSDTTYWKPQQPERWDWGAGFFTRMAAECLFFLAPEIHTVDICAEHIARCRVMTEEFSSI